MMNKKCLSAIWVLHIIAIFAYPVYGQTIHVVTEEYPPYNFTENGKITGVSTDVVRAVLKEVGLEADIKSYPWPRAWRMALENENTMIYSISKVADRKDMFKWIGVVAPADNYLFALKKREDIKIVDLDDAKKYMIGTVRNDVADAYLIKNGFAVGGNIERGPNYELNMKKLLSGRIDLWFCAELVGNYLLKKHGYNPKETVRKAYFMDDVVGDGFYMAFSKSTPDYIVEKFRKAIEKVKKDGTYSRILKNYLQ